VTIHTPLTEETHHLIGRDELDLMKSTAILINTSGPGGGRESPGLGPEEREDRAAD